MPLDGTDYLAKPATPCAVYLIRVLREGPDSPLWPAGFGPWDYTSCNTCGVGLTERLWPDQTDENAVVSDQMGKAFGLDDAVVNRVFYAVYDKPVDDHSDVTPAHVADALERALTHAWRAA